MKSINDKRESAKQKPGIEKVFKLCTFKKWLIPKESGGKVTVTIKENDGSVDCIVDDNGIDRDLSKQYKPQYEATHQSKGIG